MSKPRIIAVGRQSFEEIVSRNSFYVDKTKFIADWWNNNDEVTILTRPRRFGKTLLLNTVDRFFSLKYKDQPNLFENLAISKDAKMVNEQNNWPVISLSFAGIKGKDYATIFEAVRRLIYRLYSQFYFLVEEKALNPLDTKIFETLSINMDATTTIDAISNLSEMLYKYYKKKAIILLDEYDTPLYEVFVANKEGAKHPDFIKILDFMRVFFNSSFKTNPYASRVLMTGITHVAKQSLFSDFNNPKIVTTTVNKYTDACGFTQEEMEDIFVEYDIADQKDKIKDYYDGYIFGKRQNIYNPWSISLFLDSMELKPYWVATSSDKLLTQYIRRGNASVKCKMESLLDNKTITTQMDESITLENLENDETAFWSLCVATGYLKVISKNEDIYTLEFTNKEIAKYMEAKVKAWFKDDAQNYNSFVNALISDDVDEMNTTLSAYTENVFSYFDTTSSQPEKFYHGFVLGLMLDLRDRYIIESNRKSGRGRYDVILIPREGVDLNGIIIEFKTLDARQKENTLKDTVISALKQIENKNYAQKLLDHGIHPTRIRKYAIAFKCKEVLIKRWSEASRVKMRSI